MAVVTFPRKDVEKEVKLTEENIEKVSLMGAPLESLTDEQIEIEVFPNRPDLLSMQGFLRAFKAFIGKAPGLPSYKIQKSNAKIVVDPSVKKVRPYCMAAIIKGVKFDNEKIIEIMQWQEKIHATIGRNRKKVALGYYILDKIKFPIKYTTKSPKDIEFEPLDMPQKMTAVQIMRRHPCGRDYGHLLDGHDKYPVYYDASNQVLSLPPIINSNDLGKITPGVSDILIECSGTDLDTLKRVTAMAVADLIDMGGKAYSVDIVYGSQTESVTFTPEKMKISLENTNKLIGLNLKEKDLEKLLPKMGYDYKDGTVLIPSWRSDILHEVDLIEDVTIAYGYNNLEPIIPDVATIAEESPLNNPRSKIAEVLSGIGFIETSTFHLIKQEEAKKIKLPEEKIIATLDSKTDYKILRPNLIIPTLRILTENKDNEYPQKIFEIGTVFSKDNDTRTNIKEQENLVIASTPSNFTELKQVLDYLFRSLDIKYTLEEANSPNTN